MSTSTERSFRVRRYECDLYEHLNNSHYLRYLDAVDEDLPPAGVRVSAAHEWPLTRCAKEGFAIVLRRHEIECGAAVTLDDEVEISTWASDARRSAVIRHYLLRRRTDGVVVARFRSLHIWVSLGSGRPIRIPETFLASFAPNFAIG